MCGGASIPDVDASFKSHLLGDPLDTNAIPEDDDQEPKPPPTMNHSARIGGAYEENVLP